MKVYWRIVVEEWMTYISNKTKIDKIKQMWAKTFLMRVSVNESSKKKKPKKNILSVISFYVFYMFWINDIGNSHYISNLKKDIFFVYNN